MRFPNNLIIPAALLLFSFTTKAQCPAGSIDSNNELVVNGDFEQGDTGFSSEYIPCNTADCLYDQAHYAVGTDPSFFHPNFDGSDHTTGDGNFMIVNGAPNPGVSVWCQTVAVQPNTLYLFSSWVTSVNASNPAALQFSINGVPLGNVFSAPSYTFFGTTWPGWSPFDESWYSDTNTVATICVLNQETNVAGNDFGLDDISFQACTCTFATQPVTPASVCSGAPATLTAAAGATSYEWSPSSGLNQTTGSSVTASPTTTTTYTVVATLNNCSDTVTTIVSVAPSVAANAGNDTTVCSGNAVTLTASGGTVYTWTPNSGLSTSTGAVTIAQVNQTTTYTVNVTNGGGCTGSDTVVITVPNPGLIVASNDTSICFGNSVDLHVFGASSYSWLPSNSVTCSTCASTTASPTTTTTYTVTATTASCTDDIPIVVTVWSLPIADAGNHIVACSDQPINLSASGGSVYVWTPSTGLSSSIVSNPVATLQQNQTYTVTVNDINGCSDNDTVSITINPLPTATVGPDLNVCIGHTAVLTASGGNTYSWSPDVGLNTTTSNAVTATVTNTITYTVTATDVNGCTDDAQLTLFTLAPYVLSGTFDTLICKGAPFILSVSGAVHYNWTGPDGNCNDCDNLPISFAATSGTYHVEAIDSNGCEASADVNVIIDNTCEKLQFPTAFSPNNDNINDLFRPISQSIQSVHFYVYNRWGQLMYSGAALDKGWNGMFNSVEQPVGAYSWYAAAVTVTGEALNLQGSVTLVR